MIPNLFHTASIWLTLALAVQRYIYVCHAPLARKFCTMPNVYKCVFYIMVTATLHQSTRLFDKSYSEVSAVKVADLDALGLLECHDSGVNKTRAYSYFLWSQRDVNLIFIPTTRNLSELCPQFGDRGLYAKRTRPILFGQG